jgi:hypothetical protein
MVDKGRMTRHELRKIMFGPDAEDIPEAKIERQPEEADPAVSGFIEKFLGITGSEKDFITVQEVFNRFIETTESDLTRNMFVRQVQRASPSVLYKQKKIDGEPILVFCGVKFKE